MGSYLFSAIFEEILRELLLLAASQQGSWFLRRNGCSVLLRTDRKKSHFFINKSVRYWGWFLRSKSHLSLPFPSYRTKLGCWRLDGNMLILAKVKITPVREFKNQDLSPAFFTAAKLFTYLRRSASTRITAKERDVPLLQLPPT